MQNAVVRTLGVPDLTTTAPTRTAGARFLHAGAPQAPAAAVVLLVVVTAVRGEPPLRPSA